MKLADGLAGAYMLQLVVEDVKRNLEDEIVEALRPKIRVAVDKAVADLRPRLDAMVDNLRNELVVRLTVREMPEAEPRRDN